MIKLLLTAAASLGTIQAPVDELPLQLGAASERPLQLGATGERPLQLGEWWAWVISPGGKITFGLTLSRDAALEAQLVNGAERIPVPAAVLEGRQLVLSMNHYDSTLTATLDASGQRLVGEWKRRRGPDEWTRMPFGAEAFSVNSGRRPAGQTFEFEPGEQLPDFRGRWAVDFEHDEDPAVGIFDWGAQGQLRGTFLTTLGDYRFLAGTYAGRAFELSCFDGAHAFLFKARLQEDGSLRGDFWSRDTWHETWTAKRDPDARLPDPFELTKWTGALALGEVAFPDTSGKLRKLDDPAFAGKARILQVFGTWCPNCNDEAPYLAELDRRYRKRGLSILGLAFELTGDHERDAAQVEVYRKRYGVEFPVLVAGIADKAEASKAFPLLDRVRSYPTTIFLTGDGQVRAVHTGYAGPAAGAEHEKLRADFERLIEELLADEWIPLEDQSPARRHR